MTAGARAKDLDGEDGETPEDMAESARPRGPPPPESAAGIPRSPGFAHQARRWGRCATRCGLHDSLDRGDHFCVLEVGHAAGTCSFITTCSRSAGP